jgi:hypothetical protein
MPDIGTLNEFLAGARADPDVPPAHRLIATDAAATEGDLTC